MDNYRVVPRSARPRQAVDGFARAGAQRQTPPQNTQNNPQPASYQSALPRRRRSVHVPPAVLPEWVPIQLVQPARRKNPFDLAAIQETVLPKNRLSAGRAFKTWLLRGGIATMVLLLAAGGILFAQGASKTHKVFRGTARPAALSANAAQLLKGEDSGRVNVLLLGNGGGTHDAPDLTDTLIIESIDTKNKTAVMFSIPRDLWVQVSGAGNMKINAAYEIGKYNYLGKISNSNADTAAVQAGFTKIDQVIQQVLGIPIHYNVLVNFAAFRQAIDGVGGVSVNVPEALVDPTMAWENNHNPVLAPAGVQVMDGKQALLYARSRHTSSDFARSQRQRALTLALKDKVLSAGTLSNPLKVSQLINAFGDNMVTDFSLSEAMRAYGIGKNVVNSNIKSIDLVTPPNNLVTTGMMGNVSIAQPKAGLFDYTAIQSFVQQTLNPAPAATTDASTATAAPTPTTAKAETAQIAVLNGTATSGLAATKAAVLKSAGYTVGQVGNAPTKSYTKTIVVDLSNGANPKTKAYLESTFKTTAVTTLPDAAIQAGGAAFVVILGTN